MTRFTYKAIPLRGGAEPVVGRIEAADERALRDRLRDQGMIAVDVRPVSPLDALRSLASGASLRRRDVIWFYQTLRRLLDSNVPIEQAMSTMEELAPRPRLKRACTDVREALRAGSSLAEATSQRAPGLAEARYLALLRIGHESGRLRRAVELIDDSIAERERIRKTVVGQLIYPAILSLAAVGSVWFLATVVIPRFEETLTSVGAELPWMTRVTLGASRWLVWVIPPLIGLAAAALAMRRFPVPERARDWLARRILRAPVLGELIWTGQAALVCETVATMLEGGGDLLAGMEQAEQAATSPAIRDRLSSARRAVREGQEPGQALHEAGVLPPESDAIARIGSRSGDLTGALRQAGRICQQRQRELSERLLTLLGPAIIVFLAGAVVWIVVSLWMGMMSINDVGAL